MGWLFGPIVRLMILTGPRRSEVAAAAWSEIDPTAGLWTFPAERVKNGKRHGSHALPVAPQAQAILNGLPRIGANGLIFTFTGRTPFCCFEKAKSRLNAIVRELNGQPLEPWTIHDLRRSLASGMARLGVDLHVIERVLNHKSGSFAGIVGVYQRHKFEPEMRAALNKWAAHVERLTAPLT